MIPFSSGKLKKVKVGTVYNSGQNPTPFSTNISSILPDWKNRNITSENFAFGDMVAMAYIVSRTATAYNTGISFNNETGVVTATCSRTFNFGNESWCGEVNSASLYLYYIE